MTDWGHLEERYGAKRPRKMLALDGGGIRGVIPLEVLAEIERQLRETVGGGRDSFRLCEFFDYVAGTSTGAIIAAAIAKGMSVKEIQAFYFQHGEEMFSKERLLKRWHNLYKGDPLAKMLQKEFGTQSLADQDLKCLLMVVTRNATTDSPWPISTNPFAKYNDPKHKDNNLQIPLWQLVRASTAAPVYFPPEVIEVGTDDGGTTEFVFVDGGVTPYNNPAFLLYKMVTLPEYRLNWDAGENNLMLISLGTGSSADLGPISDDPRRSVAGHLTSLPGRLMFSIENDQDMNCRTVGHCVYGPVLDGEIGDMVPKNIAPGKDANRAFAYARFNPDISESGLKDLGLGDIDPAKVAALDGVEALTDLSRIGKVIAKNVNLEEQFPNFVS